MDAVYAAVLALTAEQYQSWSELGEAIRHGLEGAVQAGADPAGPEGKALTDLHRRWLTVMGNPYDPAKHRGLAELYVSDGRFTAYYDRDVPGCARFLRDAVLHWVP